MDRPPKYFLKFFRWFCHPDFRQVIEGDLMELYEERLQELGKAQADRKFRKDVMLLFRRSLMRPLEGSGKLNNYGILSSFFKVGLRNIFLKNSLSSFKLLGLAIGTGSFIVIQSYIGYQQNFDKFHEDYSSIYRIDYELSHKGNQLAYSATTPPTIAPFIASNIPGVEEYVRIQHFPDLVIRFGQAIFREDKVLIVDPSFLKVFNYSVIEGNPATALNERGSMMISRSARKKYFGEASPINKPISIDGYKDYVVTGVFEDPPKNSHLDFDILLSFETAKWWYEGETETDWTSRAYHSYLKLEDQADISDFASTLTDINQQTPQGEIDEKNEVERVYSLTKLENIYLHSNLQEELALRPKGNALYIQFLHIISIVILIIAWINYINQSTARLFVRSKEMGIRKVMGASHTNLIVQFLVESLLIHLFSLGLVAVGIFVYDLAFPENTLLDGISNIQDSDYLNLITLTVVGGYLLTSFLPALYVTTLNLTKALKGKLKSGATAQTVRKVMVSIQLTASAIFIASSIIIFLQLQHVINQKPGFEKEKMLVVRGPMVGDWDNEVFSAALKQRASVLKVSSGQFLPGESNLSSAPVARGDGQEYQRLTTMFVDYGYLSSLKVNFLAGGDFNQELSNGKEYVIINESAFKKLGFASAQEAIGKAVKFGSGIKAITVGGVEDYQQTSAKSDYLPMVFWLDPWEWTNILVKYSGEDVHILQQAETTFKSLFPEDPFDYVFLEEYYQKQFQEDENLSEVFLLFTIIAILMSSLGLFSLTYWTTIRRTKEIGIRKVLGAKVFQIIKLLSSELSILILFTILIATPISYLVMEEWLVNYASRISLTPTIFILSAAFVIIIAALTVGSRVLTVAVSNPVNSLKDE